MKLEDKLSPVIQHGFLRSEENVILINFEHPKVYGKCVSCNFCGHLCLVLNFGGCYAIVDVTSSITAKWQMLLPHDAVVYGETT